MRAGSGGATPHRLLALAITAALLATALVTTAAPASAAQDAPPTSGGSVAAAHGMRIDAGGSHSCAIRSDGLLRCWGWDGVGQSTPPTGTFVSVANGYSHSCGVRTSGELLCWGSSAPGTADAPTGTFTSVASGGGLHTCALRTNGTAVCWGFRGPGWNGIDNTAPSGTFQKLDVGYWHSCGLRTTGTMTCWGDDIDGQINVPAGTYTDLALGDQHTCGLRTNGTIACWGGNSFGERIAPASGTYVAIAAGGRHTCAIRTDGTVDCWGNDSFGQAADPTGTFTNVALGAVHTCGIRTNGDIECWGGNNQDQVSSRPGGQYNPVQVEAGAHHTCAIDRDSTLTCWGSNTSGQTNVPAGTYRAVAAGSSHTCAIRTSGTAACWGDTANGKLAVPEIAPGNPYTFIAIAAGDQHSCGIRTDGAMLCWGAPNAGAAPAGTYTGVSAGDLHSCGVRTDGVVVCVGSNAQGQQAAPGGSFVRVAAGGRHSCAIRSDGVLLCWGENTQGQAPVSQVGPFSAVVAGDNHTCAIRETGTLLCIGDVTFLKTSSPLGEHIDVSVGDDHSCAVRANGTITCWGSPAAGQLGVPPVAGPTTLPGGTVGAPYNVPMAGGAVPAPTFTLSSGSFPTGVSMNSLGVIAGTPTAAGAFAPRIVARSVLGTTDQTYSLTVAPALPNLRVTALGEPPASRTQAEKFPVSDTTRNAGAGAAEASVTRYYLSVDKVRDGGDRRLVGGRAVGALASNAEDAGSRQVKIPLGAPVGQYFLLACADDTIKVAESNENDNCQSSNGRIQVKKAFPDLRVTGLADPPTSAKRSAKVRVTDTTKNVGLAPAAPSVTRYYLSLDKFRDNKDRLLIGGRSLTRLAAGKVSQGSVRVTVPSNTPRQQFFLLACADDTKVVKEKVETNNCRASKKRIRIT
jgi:alpha-tubulin suppressor-like RCC1 family protein